MKNLKITLVSLAIALGFAMSASAQDSTATKFSVGADLVSSYVWRGVPQDITHPNGTPNIQPGISFKTGGLTIGAWGSGSFTGTVKEFDLYVSYAICDAFTVTVTDYDWLFGNSYFNYKKDETDHIFEGTLSYAGVDAFPLSVSVNTMFLGADKKIDDNGKSVNAYSTYVEFGYPLATNVNAFLGASLTDSPSVYGNEGAQVINIGLKATKELKFSESFSLPVYGVVGVNPQSENAYLVAGITF